MASVRDVQFAHWHRRALRKQAFHRFRMRQSALARTARALVDAFTIQTSSGPLLPIFLIGNAGRDFGRVRTKGPKPPVLELRALLAQLVPVVICDEFRCVRGGGGGGLDIAHTHLALSLSLRTSKCCIACGLYLHHPLVPGTTTEKYNVFVCDTADCDMKGICVNRDVSASQKIGGLAIAKQLGLDLGAFARGSTVSAATRTSVIKDTLARITINEISKRTTPTSTMDNFRPRVHAGGGPVPNVLRPHFAVGRRDRSLPLRLVTSAAPSTSPAPATGSDPRHGAQPLRVQ
jgi:hypothetical protein